MLQTSQFINKKFPYNVKKLWILKKCEMSRLKAKIIRFSQKPNGLLVHSLNLFLFEISSSIKTNVKAYNFNSNADYFTKTDIKACSESQSKNN